MIPFRKPEKQPEEIPVKNNRQFKTSSAPVCSARGNFGTVAGRRGRDHGRFVAPEGTRQLLRRWPHCLHGRAYRLNHWISGHRHQHRKHYGRPDVRSVSNPRGRRFACSRRYGARMLPQLEELRNYSRRAHGLERIFLAQASRRLSSRPSFARAFRIRLNNLQ